MPRIAERNWAMASQRVGGRRIGLNFGGQWTDGTGMTENAVFIDGRMSKISEDVIFTYGVENYMAPWSIKTKFSNTVDLTFTPFFERTSQTKTPFMRSKVHQLVGYFNGYVHIKDSAPLIVRQMLGCADDHRAKW